LGVEQHVRVREWKCAHQLEHVHVRFRGRRSGSRRFVAAAAQKEQRQHQSEQVRTLHRHISRKAASNSCASKFMARGLDFLCDAGRVWGLTRGGREVLRSWFVAG
jgi:hypothetical protein